MQEIEMKTRIVEEEITVVVQEKYVSAKDIHKRLADLTCQSLNDEITYYEFFAAICDLEEELGEDE